ncbi:MAG TPA: hypothetical protein VFA48_05685, partial [Gammaproteobacteria bacterium]|nr:hypothetical protein [Gammaproteobacteria bacterium]
GSKTSAIYKALGSIGIVGAARVAYLICEDKNDPDRRLMLPTKSNVSRVKTGLAFAVDSKYIDIDGKDQSIGFINWSDEIITLSADDALTGEDDSSPKISQAKDFLYDQLAAGSRKSTEIYRLAEQQGISETTLKRARQQAGINSYQVNGQWHMALSEHEQQED